MPKCADLLARLSEFLNEIQDEPALNPYLADKGAALQEEIDLWLEAHDTDCDPD